MPTARASTVNRRVSTRVRRTSPRQGPRAPMQLVERMVVEASLVVTAYTDRLLRALEPLLQERYGLKRDSLSLRHDAIDLGEVFEQVREGQVSQQFLERMFNMVDHQAANDLQRVVSVPLSGVLPDAARSRDAWVDKNTSLIRLEERAQKEVRAIIEAPIEQGVRVEEIRARIQERMGVVRSRAELIARDQTLKLYGQIQEERQTQAGIEEYTWSTSDDERVRHRHAELEGTTQRWDSPPIVDRKTGRREHPGGDFQCLPGQAQITFAGPVNRLFRRWYAGELTELVTASGETLQCTPNHPVLTAAGWQPAKAVQVGDDVVQATVQRRGLAETDVEHRVARIEQVFEAHALAFGLRREPGVAAQFHHDGTDEQVDVVDVNGDLLGDAEAALSQRLSELDLADADPPTACLRQAELVLESQGLASHDSVRALRLRLAQFFASVLEARDTGLAAPPNGRALSLEEIAHGRPLYTEPLGKCFDAGPSAIGDQAFILREWLRVVRRSIDAAAPEPCTDAGLANALRMQPEFTADGGPGRAVAATRTRVVEVRRVDFVGHVYNLSTAGEWYMANGLCVHNCRCAAIPILPTGEEAPISEVRPSVRPPANDVTLPPEERELAGPLPPDPVALERERLAAERTAREAARERQAAELAAAEARAATERERLRIEAERAAEAERQRALEAKRVEAARLAEERRRRELDANPTARLRERIPAVRINVDAPVELRRAVAEAFETVNLPGVQGLTMVAKTKSNGTYEFAKAKVVIRSRRVPMKESLPDVPGPGKVWSISYTAKTEAEAVSKTTFHELGHHAHLHESQRFPGPAGATVTGLAAERLVAARWHASDREYLTDYAVDPRTFPDYRASEYFAEAFAAYHTESRWLKRVAPKAYQLVEAVLNLRRSAK